MSATPDPDPIDFDYSNLTGRPSGPVVRALSTVLSGVAAVQRQVSPYAEAWRALNLAALNQPERVRWIALGDSMTQGIGASAPERGWVGQLAERLPEPVALVNLAQSGARVEDVILTQLPAWRRRPSAPHGEVVTVLIGANDVISPRHRSLLPEAFDELLGLLPPGAIVSTIANPTRIAARVNASIRAAAEAGRIVMVGAEAMDPTMWRGRLAADNFHPNDAGYTMIADLFAAAVSEQVAAARRG